MRPWFPVYMPESTLFFISMTQLLGYPDPFWMCPLNQEKTLVGCLT